MKKLFQIFILFCLNSNAQNSSISIDSINIYNEKWVIKKITFFNNNTSELCYYWSNDKIYIHGKKDLYSYSNMGKSKNGNFFQFFNSENQIISMNLRFYNYSNPIKYMKSLKNFERKYAIKNNVFCILPNSKFVIDSITIASPLLNYYNDSIRNPNVYVKFNYNVNEINSQTQKKYNSFFLGNMISNPIPINFKD